MAAPDILIVTMLVYSVVLQAKYLPSNGFKCSNAGEYPIVDGQPSIFNFTGEIFNKTAEELCEDFMGTWIEMVFVMYIEPVPKNVFLRLANQHLDLSASPS